MATISEQWTSFLDRCLERRVRGQQFHSLVAQLHRRASIFGPKLAEILITRQDRMGGMVDPLLPVYAEFLLERGRISSADLLGALYKHSKASAKVDTPKVATFSPTGGKICNTAEFESIIFEVLTRAYLPGGGQPKTQDETRVALVLLTEWLNANVTRGTNLADESDHQTLIDAMTVFESFGALSIAMLENTRVAGVIEIMLPKETKKKLTQALTSFVQFWSTAAPQHAQSVARLDLARKTRALIEEATVASQDAALDVAAAMQIDSVVDMQKIYTRPHVFVFINALLTGCPLTDESLMMSYLHTRHGGNAQTLAIELIYASFDTLAAAAERNDSQHAMFTLKSFLVHKVPLLLTTLAGSLIAPELVIQQALSHIDLNVFPTVGLGMLQSNTVLQDTRQDFVYTCILHGLLATDSVGRLLGESTFDTPPLPSSRLHKDALVQQCATEAGKVVQLVAQLEKLDGNAGAIAGAVVESIRTACATKDTMSLRSICNAFAGKPAFLDVILMFVSPASLLQPLCQILDTWKYEDDQGESQPVYDEFSAVFLLVLTFIYRYEFSPADLGINKDSFIAKYLAHNHQEELQSQLSAEQSRHLAGWIKGLFDSDGIPEEVTSSCQPQQFYMLVPTIIGQTILACSTGVLGIDAIGNGLEYLSETFLLPSLVSVIHWLTAYARENPGDNTDILMQILQRVTKPPGSSEAQAMHSSVMAIVALPLVSCLNSLQKRNPKRADLAPIAKLLRSHTDFRRGPFSPCTQSHAWTASAGGLRQAVKTAFQGLIRWNVQLTTMNPAQLPPPYNQRLFLIAERLLGAPGVLGIILTEIKDQTENPAGSAAAALDIATALVCAPKTENSPVEVTWPTSPVPAHQTHQTKRVNLREALSLEHERVTNIIKRDATLAESIVRLHRLVEAQANIGTVPLPDLASTMPAPDMQQMLDSMAATAQQNTADVLQSRRPTLDLTADSVGLPDLTAMSGADPMQMDFSGAGDDGMGMGGLLAGGGSMNPDDDVFGDLDFSNMDGMDTMDTEYGF